MATPIPFALPPSAVKEALALADASFQRNAKKRGGREHYPNTPKSHKVGKVGEAACAMALTENRIIVAANFRDPSRESEADIVAGGWRLEVKSWSDYAWNAGGRCVTPGQLPQVRDKADCIVWCTVESKLEEGGGQIRGWSTVEDIARTTPRTTEVGQYKILNHQVEVDDIRDFADLLSSIRHGLPGTR